MSCGVAPASPTPGTACGDAPHHDLIERSESSILAELHAWGFGLSARAFRSVEFVGVMTRGENLMSGFRVARTVRDVPTSAALSLTSQCLHGEKNQQGDFICGPTLTFVDFIMYERITSRTFSTEDERIPVRQLSPWAVPDDTNRHAFRWLRVMEAPLLLRNTTTDRYAMACRGKESQFSLPEGQLRSPQTVLQQPRRDSEPPREASRLHWGPRMLQVGRNTASRNKLRVVSYNVLSTDAYDRYKKEYSWASKSLTGNERIQCLAREVISFRADIITLCELDKRDFSTWKDEFPHAYAQDMGGMWGGAPDGFPTGQLTTKATHKQNPGNPDGILLWTHPRSISGQGRLAKVREIKFDAFNDLAGHFRISLPETDTRNIGVVLPVTSRGKSFLLCSTHLYWNPLLESYKVLQAMLFRGFIEKCAGDAPLSAIVTGDFNALANHKVYNSMRSAADTRFDLSCIYASTGLEVSGDRFVLDCPSLQAAMRMAANACIGLWGFRFQLSSQPDVEEVAVHLTCGSHVIAATVPLTRVAASKDPQTFEVDLPQAVSPRYVASSDDLKLTVKIGGVALHSTLKLFCRFGVCRMSGGEPDTLGSAYSTYPEMQVKEPEAVEATLQSAMDSCVTKLEPRDKELRKTCNSCNSSSQEPGFTTFVPKPSTPFIGCIDYIFHTKDFTVGAVAAHPSFSDVQKGLPDGRSFHSDHLPLCVDLQF